MDDPLSNALNRWQPSPESPEAVEHRVWQQIGRRRRRRVATLYAAAGLLLGAGLFSAGFWVREREDRSLQRRYLAALDLQASPAPDSLEATLRWMKDDLRLTPDQFARVEALHRDALDQLVALHREIDLTRQQAFALEEIRREQDRIDFVASESVSELRRSLAQRGTALVSHLVDATAGVLTEEQRQRYVSAVRPSLARDDAFAHD